MLFKEPLLLPINDPKSGELAKSMIIAEAEWLFGARDTSFAINDVIIYHDKPPQVSVADVLNDLCIVYLSHGSQHTWRCFMYEMAHEAVHLLNPQRISASYLEEGVAVWFSIMMCEKYSYTYRKPIGPYRQAYDLLSKIPDTVPDLVKKIRVNFPNLTDLTAADLSQTYPNLSPLDVSRLLKRMRY